MESTTDLLKRTLEWVETQGFPLEMKVAKTFRAAGFEVRQSGLYKDDLTSKYREIDLLVSYPDAMGVIQISLTIECKASRKPWLLFNTETASAGMSIYWMYSLMTQAAREALADAAPLASDDRAKSIEAQFERLIWLKKNDVSYAFRQAFTDTDTAYTALSSSMKAASHHMRAERKYPPIRFVFPLIVVDSPLFACKLGDSLAPELEEVASGEVLFTHPERYEDVTCVRVVTLQHLTTFVMQARKEFAQLTREVLPAAERIWQQEFGRPLGEGYVRAVQSAE